VGGAGSLVRGDSHQHRENWLILWTLCSRKGTSSSGWSRESGTEWQPSTHRELAVYYVLFVLGRTFHPVGGAGSLVRGDSHRHLELLLHRGSHHGGVELSSHLPDQGLPYDSCMRFATTLNLKYTLSLLVLLWSGGPNRTLQGPQFMFSVVNKHHAHVDLFFLNMYKKWMQFNLRETVFADNKLANFSKNLVQVPRKII
jgi:hypothetical protein